MEPIGKEGEFRRRVKEIYSSIHDTIRKGRFYNVDQKTLDGRPGLLRAMFDTFLGRDYNIGKRRQVEALQAGLRSKQEELAGKLAVGSLSREDYFRTLTQEIENTFQQCERILGAAEFRELFGAPPDAVKGFVDKDVFLKSGQK